MTIETLIWVAFAGVGLVLLYVSIQEVRAVGRERRQRSSEPVMARFGPATDRSPQSWSSGDPVVAAVAMQQTVATAMAVAEGVASPLSYGEREAMQRSSTSSLDLTGNQEKNPATPATPRCTCPEYGHYIDCEFAR